MPSPDTLESELRRRIWWLILDLDVQVSMHIGRPLAVRVQSGIDRPTLEGLEGVCKDLEQSRLDFKQYALEVLEGLCAENDQPREQAHDTLVAVAKLDRLQRMEKQLPHLNMDEDNDEHLAVALADYKIELLAFKMMLCCSLAMSAQKQESSSSKLVLPKDGLPGLRKANTTKLGRPRGGQRDEAYTYQTAILDSARSILATFEKTANINTLDRHCNWNRCFDTYCAVAILAIAVLRRETRLSSDLQLITAVYRLLQNLADRNPYFHLANVAVTRIGQLHAEIEKIQKSLIQKPQLKAKMPTTSSSTGGPSGRTNPWKSSAGLNALASSPSKKRKTRDFDLPTDPDRKMVRREPSSPYREHVMTEGGFDSSVYGSMSQRQTSSTRASAPGGNIDHDLQAKPLMGTDISSDAPTGTAASFEGGTNAAQYSSYFAYTGRLPTNTDSSYLWSWHQPPLLHPQIPLVDYDSWNVPSSTVGSNPAMHQTAHGFEDNLEAEGPTPFDQSTTIGSLDHAYYTQDSLPGSMPHTANQSREGAPYMTSVQTPVTPSHETSDFTGHHLTGPAHDDSSYGWEFVQNQQNMSRRNSYYQAFETPTTTAAWG
jgi:hypothetical protein